MEKWLLVVWCVIVMSAMTNPETWSENPSNDFLLIAAVVWVAWYQIRKRRYMKWIADTGHLDTRFSKPREVKYKK